MIVFLDFEASSLSDDSYPIEVAWAGEDGSSEQHLIRPAPDWSDWSGAAEAVHKIPRERLLAEGEPHEEVARRALEALAPHGVFVTAPSWDGKWMSVLLRSAGLPRHALRLKDADEAHLTAAWVCLGSWMTEAEATGAALWVIAEARRQTRPPQPAHRALADAKSELLVWREVQRLAAQFAERPRTSDQIRPPGPSGG